MSNQMVLMLRRLFYFYFVDRGEGGAVSSAGGQEEGIVGIYEPAFRASCANANVLAECK